MGKITLKEYAERHGKLLNTLHYQNKRGLFKTTVKQGRDWFIDEDEPLPTADRRVKSGAYVDWRKNLKKNKPEQNDA